MTFEEWWKLNHVAHTADVDKELVEIIKNFSRVAWEAAKPKWQPIEAAPERTPVLAIFEEIDDNYVAAAIREGDFWWTDTCGDVMEANTNPTRWMPMPEPPKELEE